VIIKVECELRLDFLQNWATFLTLTRLKKLLQICDGNLSQDSPRCLRGSLLHASCFAVRKSHLLAGVDVCLFTLNAFDSKHLSNIDALENILKALSAVLN